MDKKKIKIAWWGKHFGEEPPLTGNEKQGAGGIFFSGCNLRCVFCQNWQISQANLGKEYSVQELTDIMLSLQKQGAINIDLVTPTIWWKEIKQAIILAKKQGLSIPIVWNSNGYESVDILKEMLGFIDIYLPDFKYSNDDLAWRYSKIKNYLKITLAVIIEMYNQVGLLQTKNNLATRGLIVRHLILPQSKENSFGVLNALSKIDKNIHLSLMSQYHPMHEAKLFSEINQPLKKEEFAEVYDYLLDLGFENGWAQDPESQNIFVPDFNRANPFNVSEI